METRPVKAAVLAAAVGATLLFGATAVAAGQATASPDAGMRRMSEHGMPPGAGMAQMQEMRLGQHPGMQQTDEMMLEQHAGMQRMHERASRATG